MTTTKKSNNWLEVVTIPGFTFQDGSFWSNELRTPENKSKLTAVITLDRVAPVVYNQGMSIDFEATNKMIADCGFFWKGQSTYMLEERISPGKITKSLKVKCDHIDIHVLPIFQDRLDSMCGDFDKKAIEELNKKASNTKAFIRSTEEATEANKAKAKTGAIVVTGIVGGAGVTGGAGVVGATLGVGLAASAAAIVLPIAGISYGCFCFFWAKEENHKLKELEDANKKETYNKTEKGSVTFKVYSAEKSHSGVIVQVKHYVGTHKRLITRQGYTITRDEECAIEFSTIQYLISQELIENVQNNMPKKMKGFMTNILAAFGETEGEEDT